MNALERLNLTKELRQLVDTIPDMKGMDKLQSTKRLRELIERLGGQATSEVNKLYQSIIDGEEEASIELLLKVRSMSGGKLTVEQVIAGDQIIAASGLSTFAQSIGFVLPSSAVSGQWNISENGYSLIRELEGFRADAYLDTGGVWTIAFGTIKFPNGTRV